MADVRIAPDATQIFEDSDTVHVTCCDDDNVTLCGLDASSFTLTTDQEDCVVCAELAGTGFCPKGLSCEDDCDGWDMVLYMRRLTNGA